MIEIIAESTQYDVFEELKEILKNRKTKRVSNWWYLHGKLEEDMGFDKGIMLDNDYLKCVEFIDTDINKSYKEYYLEDGIYKVKIIQIDKPCKGYFWTKFEEFGNIEGEVPVMHGLVCYVDDKEANDYAYKKYIKKSNYL